MEKFSANYAYTNNNFVIQNIKNEKVQNLYTPIVCILKNIIQRGTPTMMSRYLKSVFGEIEKAKDFEQYFELIDNVVPNWGNRIKGDIDNSNYPARRFFEGIIPQEITEYQFIRQLILPEAYINEIINKYNERFVNEQVDFYLPQAKLVIEIDGWSHKEEARKISDFERDRYLSESGILTIRINTSDLDNKTEIFYEKIALIKNRLEKYFVELEIYKKNYEVPFDMIEEQIKKNKLLPTAIIRMQVLFLTMLEKGILSLNDEIWKINIIERDIKDFTELAAEDIFIWIEQLCRLQKIFFKRPKLMIRKCKSIDEFDYTEESINIDFSVMKRWTEEAKVNKRVIFIRNDYFNDRNYFQVSTSNPIRYELSIENEEDKKTLEFFLKNIFNNEKFNDGQLPIIINSLKLEDTIGLLPTGGGKSLCYQLAAILQPSICFVVCPIKSLMKDQKLNLDRKLINHTAFITSDLESKKKKDIEFNFGQGKYLFIWISPERFQNKNFRLSLEQLCSVRSIAYGVIDEVHCLSEWGHDFRTSYLNLVSTIKRHCPGTKLLGLTATASKNVLKDIEIEFNILPQNIKTLITFTRPELKFHVIKDDNISKDSKYNELKNLVSELNEKKQVFEMTEGYTKGGIIFTVNVNGDAGCYPLASKLSKKFARNIKWYSGDMPKNCEELMNDRERFDVYRDQVQLDFQNNKIPLLIATKAFGMGVDKSNIRYTIHYGLPGSLEALYQEAGRAGRDKKEADCYVLYTPESCDSSYLDIIFKNTSTRQDILQVNNMVGWNGRDVFRNIFLWLNSNKDIEEEIALMRSITDQFYKRSSKQIIETRRLNATFSDVQKAVYRLKLLGIIEDWTIEDWNKGVMEASFLESNESKLKYHLIQYIRKYDKNFILKDSYSEKELDGSPYAEYIRSFQDNSLRPLERYGRILLQWTYDNFSYNRRQSLKTVRDRCEEFTDSESFKSYIEGYFKFTDTTFVLDYITEKPSEFTKWFDVFFKKENEDRVKRFVKEHEIIDLKNNLSRFLESFRNNPGLNIISGLVRLLCNDYFDQDGKERFEFSLRQIVNNEPEVKEQILDGILEIGEQLDKNNRYYLSSSLCEYYPDKVNEIYEKLNDNKSLGLILTNSDKKIKNFIGRLF